MKVGAVYQQTFLDEQDSSRHRRSDVCLPSLTDANGAPLLQPTTHQAIDAPCTDLFPYDLTQPGGGSLYTFNGHTDVKELSLYVRDNITKGNWSLNLGLRGDFYNGLTAHKEAEPRLGVAYNVKKTNTVLRVSYARCWKLPSTKTWCSPAPGARMPS